MGRNPLIFTTFLFISAGLTAPTLGAEQLRFDQTISQRAQKNIHLHMQGEDVKIAGIDLNEDGMDEFIVSNADCTKVKQNCTYSILADKDNNLITLGTIKARTLLLGDSYSHGIRDILAYDNDRNDFDYTLYVWEPTLSRYTIGSGARGANGH